MFQKKYMSLVEYGIWEVSNSRFVSESSYIPYLEWLENNNTPEVVSGDDFITIVNGEPVQDPNMESILAAEEYAATHPPPTLQEQITTLTSVMDALLLGA